MDQVYASLQRTGAVTEHYDIIIIGSGAGGGTMAHALADSRRAHLDPRARRLRSAGRRRTGTRRRSGRTSATRRTERWLDERGREFRPYTHYCVGGNTKFWGSVLYRLRREDFQAVEHVDGVSPAWPIDYDTLAPYYERAERLYHVRGADGDRSDRAAARSVSRTRRCRTRAGWRRSSSSCARRACTPRRCRSGCSRPGEAGRLHPLQHLQFVRVQAPREERSRRLLRPSGDRRGRT